MNRKITCSECGKDFKEKDFKTHMSDGLRHREKYLQRKSNLEFRLRGIEEYKIMNVFDTADGNPYHQKKITKAKAELINIISKLGHDDGECIASASKDNYGKKIKFPTEELRYRNERNLLVGLLNAEQLDAYDIYRRAFMRIRY